MEQTKPTELELTEYTELRARLAEAEEALRTVHKRDTAELNSYRQQLEGLAQDHTNRLTEQISLQKIFDMAQVGLMVVGADGIVKQANEMIRRWMGKRVSQLTGMQVGDALGCTHVLADRAGCGNDPACASCKVRHVYQTVIQTGKPVRGVVVEFDLTFGGHPRSIWLEINADLLEAVGQRQAMLVLNDVSARVKAERALQKAYTFLEKRVEQRARALMTANARLQREVAEKQIAEEKLQTNIEEMQVIQEQLYTSNESLKVTQGLMAKEREKYLYLFDFAPSIYITTDLDGVILEANKAARDLLRGRNPRLEGMSLADFIDPADRSTLTRSLARLQNLENISEWETSLLLPHDQTRQVSISASGVREPSDRSIDLHWLINDITESKKAKQALQLAYAYNRSLIEASLDPLATITPAGKIGDVNSAMEKVTGRSRQELVGTDFIGCFSDPERARQGYHMVFDTGSVHDYELEIRHKDGHITPVLYNASLYRDETGQIQGIFAVARDITDRKQFEAQLMQAEKHAVVGRMMGSVTHEINNPLQTIKNCLYLIQQDIPQDSSTLEPLDMAFSEMERVTDLVGQLRELYRPRVDVQEKPHELLDILEEVHTLLAPHMNNSNVSWYSMPGLTRCYATCVRDQVLEVFLNVIMNAIEAMQASGGNLYVDMVFKGRQVGVVFRDTGPGIPENIFQHLFEPFQTTKSSGLGLGLSISYGIVQRYGGHIHAENCPDGGASFTIWMPIGSRKKKEKRNAAAKQ